MGGLKRSSNEKPAAALVLGMFLWAGSFVALKWAFQGYDPFSVIWGRMVVGSLFGLVLWKKFKLPGPSRSDWGSLLLMSLLEPGLFFILHTQALIRTTASQAGGIAALMPLLAAMGAWWFLREKTGPRVAAGLILAVGGAAFLSWGVESSGYAPRPVFGNMLELGAVACGAAYTLLARRLSNRYSPLLLTVFQAFFGVFFFAPFLFIFPPEIPARTFGSFLALVFFLGVFSTFGAYGLYNYGISRLPVSRSSSFVALIPVFTVLLSFLILDETLSGIQYGGIGLVVTGLLIATGGK